MGLWAEQSLCNGFWLGNDDKTAASFQTCGLPDATVLSGEGGSGWWKMM